LICHNCSVSFCSGRTASAVVGSGVTSIGSFVIIGLVKYCSQVFHAARFAGVVVIPPTSDESALAYAAHAAILWGVHRRIYPAVALIGTFRRQGVANHLCEVLMVPFDGSLSGHVHIIPYFCVYRLSFMIFAEPHMLPTLAEPHMLSTLAESHMIPTLAEPYMIPTLAEPFMLPTLAEPHMLSTLAESYMIPTLAEPHMLPTLAESHMIPTLAESHMLSTLAESYMIPTLAESHMLPTLAEPHMLSTLAEPHMLSTLAEPHMLPTLAEPHMTIIRNDLTHDTDAPFFKM
jgi:hypothetical protein